MKIKQLNSISSLILFGAMAVGLWSCQKENVAIPDNTGILVSVSDGGFQGLPQTRSTENGYKTTFAAGDKIGLYSVKNNALLDNNVCLTLTEVSGTLVWKAPDGVKLSYLADRFFAYYPYQSSPATVTANATTADTFFANLITGWTPATDQSTQAKYTAQDLMTGSGSLSSTPTNGVFTLTFSLFHKMGLAVITLPTGVTDVAFSNFTPFSLNSSYRYLVKPATATTLKGAFTDRSSAREYTIPVTIAGGNYKNYTINGITTAKVGDYYYSDDTFSTTVIPGKTCIGIVFLVNPDGLSGKIVSLDKATWTSWSTEWAVTGATSATDGRANMATIATYISNNSKSWDTYPAFKWAAGKNGKPSGGWEATDKWYLPASNELIALIGVKATVNASLIKISQAEFLDGERYWSSKENYNGAADLILSDGSTYNGNKTMTQNVRAISIF